MSLIWPSSAEWPWFPQTPRGSGGHSASFRVGPLRVMTINLELPFKTPNLWDRQFFFLIFAQHLVWENTAKWKLGLQLGEFFWLIYLLSEKWRNYLQIQVEIGKSFFASNVLAIFFLKVKIVCLDTFETKHFRSHWATQGWSIQPVVAWQARVWICNVPALPHSRIFTAL